MLKELFSKKFIKDKNYILLFFGNLVSGVGSRIYGFGISLFLLDLTGLAVSMSTYLAIWAVVIFTVSPIAATFTDRWKNKPRVIYLADFGRGVLYFVTALVVGYYLKVDQSNYVVITVYISIAFSAIQTAFFSPSIVALVPQIVESEELVSASSIMQITRSIQNIAGLLFGALLYYNFGIVALMIINSISFIISGISEMFIAVKIPKNLEKLNNQEEVKETNEKEKVVKRIYNDLKTALVYLFKEAKPILMITLIILVSTTLIGPWGSVGIPYLIKKYFIFTSMTPEYILASSEVIESLGVIITSFIIGGIASRFKLYQLIRIGGILFIILSIMIFSSVKAFDLTLITDNLFIIFFMAISFLGGLVNASINAPLSAALQKYIDPNKIGKVSTLIDSFGGLLFPISVIVAGKMIDYLSIYYVILMMLVGLILIVFIAFKSNELKKLI